VKIEEAMAYAARIFDGKEVSYWKLRPLPSLKELKNPKPTTEQAKRGMDDYVKNVESQKLWEKKAVKAMQTPSTTKAEFLTIMEGIASNTELLQQVKERAKKARS
jgi:hypothetical protein